METSLIHCEKKKEKIKLNRFLIHRFYFEDEMKTFTAIF